MVDLEYIRNKMRRLTARDSSQLSNADCDEYINSYLQYSLPADLRILKFEGTYTFTTRPNIDTYFFDSENYSYLENPVRIGGYPALFMTDPAQFFAIRPRFSFLVQVATGDGTAGPYTGTINTTPFHRSYNTLNTSSDLTLATFPTQNPIGVQTAVLFSAKIDNSQSLNAVDSPTIVSGSGSSVVFDDTGFFIGDVAGGQNGSINYISGEFSIEFSAVVPAGQPIYASVYNYAASRPRFFLFYQNQIILSPVPDNAYIVEVKSYRKPVALLNDTSMPELQEMGDLIAAGAGLKVFEDNADLEGMAGLMPVLERYEQLVRSRGLIQRTRTRIPTIYSTGLYGGVIADASPYFAGN